MAKTQLSDSSAMRPVLVLALLTALNFVNYIDRYILFAVQPLIKREFHPSDTALGTLTSVFLLFYMCCAPGIGVLADRSSRKVLIIVGALIWSAATWLTAVTHSFTSLLVRHTIVGVGEATFSLIAPAYIADLFPEEKRGRALSIFCLALPVGAALGYIIGGALGTRYGWRSPFYVCAAPGFLIALGFYLAGAEPARGAQELVLRSHLVQLPVSKQPIFNRGSMVTAFSYINSKKRHKLQCLCRTRTLFCCSVFSGWPALLLVSLIRPRCWARCATLRDR